MNVGQAPLLGFAKSLKAEAPELHGGLLDLSRTASSREAAAALIAELSRPGHDEDAVAYRGPARLVARLARRKSPKAGRAPVRPDATYLVAGGLGALGLEVARWLAEQGARHLVLMGRREPDDRARAVLASLEAAGVRVSVVAGDVARPEAVRQALEVAAASHPPLRGVVNAAGVLEDGLLPKQSAERFRKVLAAKVDGSWNLHEQTLHLPLDFFVLYSSAVTMLGLPGRSNYTAANSFLDALARYRRAKGLPGLSVAWGAWAGVGMTAELDAVHRQQLDERGFGSIGAVEGLPLLGDLIAEGGSDVGLFPVAWSKYLRAYGGEAPPYFGAVVPRASSGSVAASDGVLGRIRTAPPGERRARLAGYLSQQVAKVLGAGDGSDLDPQQGFWAMGMDSLLSLELRNRLQTDLACRLNATLIMDYPNLAALTEHIGRTLGVLNGAESAGKREEREHPPVKTAEAKTLALSEAEAEALLVSRLEEMEY